MGGCLRPSISVTFISKYKNFTSKYRNFVSKNRNNLSNPRGVPPCLDQGHSGNFYSCETLPQTAGGVLGDYGGTVEGSSIVLEAVMWEVVTSAWFGQITSCRFRGTLHLRSRYSSLFFTRPPTPTSSTLQAPKNISRKGAAVKSTAPF